MRSCCHRRKWLSMDEVRHKSDMLPTHEDLTASDWVQCKVIVNLYWSRLRSAYSWVILRGQDLHPIYAANRHFLTYQEAWAAGVQVLRLKIGTGRAGRVRSPCFCLGGFHYKVFLICPLPGLGDVDQSLNRLSTLTTSIC